MEDSWVAPAIKNFLELFVKPEIDRRKNNKTLVIPFSFSAAQIIFYSDGLQPIVRLNEEVQAQGLAKLKPGIAKTKGDMVFSDDIEEVSQIKLPPGEDPNCGHVTILKIGNRWALSFDFIYNKELSSQHISKAEEFIQIANNALSLGYVAPFLDNLFNAAELATRAILLSVPDPNFRKKGSHSTIHNRINLEAKLGNINPDYTRAFNKLYNLRVAARYKLDALKLKSSEVSELQSAIQGLVNLAKSRIIRPDPE